MIASSQHRPLLVWAIIIAIIGLLVAVTDMAFAQHAEPGLSDTSWVASPAPEAPARLVATGGSESTTHPDASQAIRPPAGKAGTLPSAGEPVALGTALIALGMLGVLAIVVGIRLRSHG